MDEMKKLETLTELVRRYLEALDASRAHEYYELRKRLRETVNADANRAKA